MANDIITEDFRLPSLGKVYGKQFDPEVKLRSMTVADEMKRLSPSKYPYKQMAEIIDDCLINKLPISSYDMCLGDYTYLLYKLRTVTYGSKYPITFLCPNCNNITKVEVDLDGMTVLEYDETLKEAMFITLPKTEKQVKLRLQTPRDLDNIEKKKREYKEKHPNSTDQTILFTLESLIDTIDGEPFDPILGREALKQLPLADMNYLAQKATQFNEKVGVDNIILAHCDKCGNDVNAPFRINSEFFRPKIV